ncbi:hypothetical protein H5410_031923 [Solanum commersonii]|uniref:Uncharacterized protein n=1 Tax=Solanum commersonii TaxID=4109 RepID=A0A9J5YJQ0_SOLCO|nr:hypothetical protein H5410_031923 [Solanum commersonii]
MNQLAILKKKGSNPNKAQSPLKNLDFDMQYRSSVELANKFKIKREQLANERNDRAKKYHPPIPHKRKNSEDFIPQQGKSKLLGHKSVIQSSSREELSTSHMIARKGQTKQRLFQSGESIQEKGIKLPTNNSRFQTSFKEGVASSICDRTTLGNGEVQHDIKDLLNFKHVKRKSVRQATTIDQFLDNQRLHNEHDIHDLPNCKQRRHKQNIKENFFDKNSTLEDMLAKHPDGIPDNQFRQLIEYWKHPTVQRATKDNNEEPSKPEIFIATRTKTGKEIQADTQVAIAELQNRQNFGETADDAFRAVFGKEQPG